MEGKIVYLPDLFPYPIPDDNDDPQVALNRVTVGFLETDHPFLQGECPPALLGVLLNLCKTPKAITAGYHVCTLCHGYGAPIINHKYDDPIVSPGDDDPTIPIMTVHDDSGGTIYLGDGEIDVKGESGIIYRAPTLIYHYIADHNYRPPTEFIEAVLRMGESSES